MKHSVGLGLFAASLLAASMQVGLVLGGVGPAEAKDIRIGLASDPDALDPTTSTTVAGRAVFASLCDKLVDIDEKLNFVPQLATSWEWSPDLKALTFKLRQGVVFHDGQPFDAEAVVFNIDRHLKLPGSNRRSEISLVTSAEALDRHTVRLNLSEPFVPLLAALSDRAGMMISPAAAKAAGDGFGRRPVCAGPYKFVERVVQDRIVLEKFADYWDSAAYPITRVVFQPIPDATVRLSNLRARQLDIIERVAPANLKQVETSPGLRAAIVTGLGSYHIVVNLAGGTQKQSETPIGKDPRVREALELAIDREALNQVANEGRFAVGNQPEPPASPYYIRELPPPKRDVERARRLIKEATGKDRLEIRMLVPSVTEYSRAAEVIQAMVAEAGIDLRIVVTETTTLLQQWTVGDFQTLIIRWSGRTDPDGDIYTFKSCEGSRNGGKYCSPEVDKWLNQARTSSDPKQRYAAYAEAAKIYLKDRPYIYLYHPTEITGLRDVVKGFVAVPDGLIRLRNVSVAE
jgi:peptide/nickel transport system substrate-binding protein